MPMCQLFCLSNLHLFFGMLVGIQNEEGVKHTNSKKRKASGADSDNKPSKSRFKKLYGSILYVY